MQSPGLSFTVRDTEVALMAFQMSVWTISNICLSVHIKFPHCDVPLIKLQSFFLSSIITEKIVKYYNDRPFLVIIQDEERYSQTNIWTRYKPGKICNDTKWKVFENFLSVGKRNRKNWRSKLRSLATKRKNPLDEMYFAHRKSNIVNDEVEWVDPLMRNEGDVCTISEPKQTNSKMQRLQFYYQ